MHSIPRNSAELAAQHQRRKRAWIRSHKDEHGIPLLPSYSPDLGQDSANLSDFAREMSEPFFCDWVSLEQDHDPVELSATFPEGIPDFTDGIVQATDVHGEVKWLSAQHHQLRGSHDTSLRIRSHKNRVSLSGNLSRFGRPDNLWGYSLGECISRANDVLARIGLPPFTMGQRFYRNVPTAGGHKLAVGWTGCRVTRLDLTANFQTGSAENARAYLEWLGTQQTSARIKVGTHGGHGETVDWGRGSRRVYAKAYNKAVELERHDGPSHLIAHCNEVGLVRFEVTVKATQLHSMGCNYLGGLDMGQLIELFKDRATVLSRAQHSHDDFEQLPNHHRRTARDYLAGDDVRKHLSLASFKRHRAALLPYGIDIAVPRNVVDFKPRVRVIELSPAVAPSWYEFGERKAA